MYAFDWCDKITICVHDWEKMQLTGGMFFPTKIRLAHLLSGRDGIHMEEKHRLLKA